MSQLDSATTSASLLIAVRQRDEGAWHRLTQIYGATVLSVHDILGLVFGAQLKASEGIGRLRTSVRLKLIEAGLDRQFEEAQFPRRGQPSLTADRWLVPKRDSLPLGYEFIRSREAPFDFCRVNFEITQPQRFKIVTGLDDAQDRDAPSLFPEASLLSDAETKGRIAAKDFGPNVKIWRDARGKLIAFAEFAGTLLDSEGKRVDRVLLRTQEDGSIEIERRLADLCRADRDWIAEGRHWGEGEHRRQFIHSFMVEGMTTVILKAKDGDPERYRLEVLSPADRAWIRRQESRRRQAAAP